MKNIRMMKWIKDVYSFNRSITGQGTRDTLNYFEKMNSNFKRIKFKSGIKVFDWKIPKEWNVKDAYIQDSKGKKYAEFKKNNLHLVGYSTPVNKFLSKKELLNKIYTIKKSPNLIPYVTSYYKKDWGFCLSENIKNKLPNGKFKVFIDSNFSNGTLDISEGLIRGKSKKEIFFSSYICHPSMANNELSGVALLNYIMLYIKKKYKNPNFTYRFVLLPETIGSIAYLSKRIKELKKNVISGYVLSCVGINKEYSVIKSHIKNLSSLSLEASLIGKKNIKIYDFLSRGSDERQYCWPGIDLPVSTFCRVKFGSYKEYHTSADNLKIISEKGLISSFNIFKDIIDAFENGIYPKSSTLCEPMLSKYNLWPTTMKWNYYNKLNQNKKFLDFLFYSDGNRSIFEIAKLINCELKDILKIYNILRKHKIAR